MRGLGTQTRLAAAVAAGLLGIVPAAAPAQAANGTGCNSSHGHCWAVFDSGVASSEAYMSASINTWQATIYNYQYFTGAPLPWIDVVTLNGRHLSYPGIGGGGVAKWKKGYAIVSWRLCDPTVGRCTQFVTVP
jgi:hypothetical protein